MKNPKWRCAYPGTHKVKFGGKFLTQWDGYHLTLEQSTGGTISADKLKGYQGQSANLSYTANTDYYFNGWQSTGANIQNNQVPFTADTTAKGSFVYTNPTKAYNNTITGFSAAGTISKSTTNRFDASPSEIEKQTFGDIGFIQSFSANVRNKNYFVLKYDYQQQLTTSGDLYKVIFGNAQGIGLRDWSYPVDLWSNHFYPIMYNPYTNNTVLQHSTYKKASFYTQREYMYSGGSGDNLTPGTSTETYTGALHKFGKQYDWGELGTVTALQENFGSSEYEFTLSAQASGIYNNSGRCIDNKKYDFNTWRTFKYVFNMNDYSLSAYDGDKLVYLRNTTKLSARNSDGIIPKMLCMFTVVPIPRSHYVSQWEGTTDTYYSKGRNAFKNISFTYFDDCDDANMWAKIN